MNPNTEVYDSYTTVPWRLIISAALSRPWHRSSLAAQKTLRLRSIQSCNPALSSARPTQLRLPPHEESGAVGPSANSRQHTALFEVFPNSNGNQFMLGGIGVRIAR